MTPGESAPWQIRPGRPEDRAALAAVCRATASGGHPVPPDDPEAALVALVYAEPYAVLAPATARLLVRSAPPADVVGYVVGVEDTASFEQRWRREYLPSLRVPPGGSPSLRARLLDPALLRPPPEVLADYPAHLHINLLPAARGGGAGRRLVEAFLDGLVRARAPGVHLGVAQDNVSAQAFYRAVGFQSLAASPGTQWWGRALG
jgi:ribosomal protein S18 acetylase RimI-like enzyme